MRNNEMYFIKFMESLTDEQLNALDKISINHDLCLGAYVDPCCVINKVSRNGCYVTPNDNECGNKVKKALDLKKKFYITKNTLYYFNEDADRRFIKSIDFKLVSNEVI